VEVNSEGVDYVVLEVARSGVCESFAGETAFVGGLWAGR
jgi:hypothetical protein